VVSFAPGAAALADSGTAEVRHLAAAVHPGPNTTFDVAAHAPASGDDPSAARRLSLDRALAVRAALIAVGVPAANVYLRALGAPPPAQADLADRATITVMGMAGAAAAPSQKPLAQQAKPP
jgi:outer membrane protein OmpA-like peptidoglycan-associated protein